MLFKSNKLRYLVVSLLVVVSIFYLWAIVAQVWSFGYLPGDCKVYFAITRSLFEDGDILIENNLSPSAIIANTALSSSGELVPKYSVVLSVLGLPFYAIFGKVGLLVFNCLQFGLMIYFMFKLNQLVASPRTAWTTISLYLFGSFLLFYIPNFSPDILAALMILAALYFIQTDRGRFGLFIGSFSLFVKIYNAIPLAFLFVMYVGDLRALWSPWCSRPARIRLCSGLLAALLGVLPMFLYNWHYFGHPLVGGYGRMVAGLKPDGTWALMDHVSLFNVPFLKGLMAIFLDPYWGLVFCAPIFIFSMLWAIPYFYLTLISQTTKRKGLFMFAAAVNVGFLVFFARYDYWYTSHIGNRFLILPLILSSLFVSFALEIISKHGRGTGGTTTTP